MMRSSQNSTARETRYVARKPSGEWLIDEASAGIDESYAASDVVHIVRVHAINAQEYGRYRIYEIEPDLRVPKDADYGIYILDKCRTRYVGFVDARPDDDANVLEKLEIMRERFYRSMEPISAETYRS